VPLLDLGQCRSKSYQASVSPRRQALVVDVCQGPVHRAQCEPGKIPHWGDDIRCISGLHWKRSKDDSVRSALYPCPPAHSSRQKDEFSPMHIIVANDPRAYREAITAAVSAAGPRFELISLEPHELDEAIVRLEPDFVICSRVSEVLETRCAAWLLLYPDGEHLVVINVGGNRTEMTDLDFDGLLHVVERVENSGSAK
jgi:hypothetical protein